MGKFNLKTALCASLAAAMLFCASGAGAAQHTRILRGFLKDIDVKGGGIILQVKSREGAETLYLKLQNGARVTDRGVPADLKDFRNGAEVMVTYVPEDGGLSATDLRKIK